MTLKVRMPVFYDIFLGIRKKKIRKFPTYTFVGLQPNQNG